MSLPRPLPYPLHQTQWAQELDPIIKFAPNQGLLLTGISLKTGSNTINTKLGRTMQGWILIDQDAPASIYRSSSLNNLTLGLTSSADVTVALWVF